MFSPSFLLTAKHVHPRVNSEADYRARQAEALDALRLMYPNLHSGLRARVVTPNPAAFVSGGRLLVECACGNCPVVEPDWGALALCYECGAIYEGVDLPENIKAIESLLVKRANPALRYWNPDVTLSQLRQQNAVLGILE